MLKKINSAADFSNVDILFISKTGATLLSALKGTASSNNVLIVTEGAGMGQKGSIINFVEQGGEITFELKETEATKHGLKVSNDLKRLAILI